MLKTEILYDLAIPLLGIHSEDSKTIDHKDTYTSEFITPLFTTLGSRVKYIYILKLTFFKISNLDHCLL